ncbi:hypothetical protein C8J57DRAFT_280833 [Mycena rebaudengoi]|nr:hypothetical protein C8J57DRAFT_280833 [Mycena rebaudengoi]
MPGVATGAGRARLPVTTRSTSAGTTAATGRWDAEQRRKKTTRSLPRSGSVRLFCLLFLVLSFLPSRRTSVWRPTYSLLLRPAPSYIYPSRSLPLLAPLPPAPQPAFVVLARPLFADPPPFYCFYGPPLSPPAPRTRAASSLSPMRTSAACRCRTRQVPWA